MDTCFLFTKYLDPEGCFCVKLNAEGQVSAPAAQYTFEQIRILQENCKTLVVETSENICLLNLELPWLPDRKARVAIPYALEDQLAQPIEELHFAFDKQRYQNKQYLVTVISKQRMQYIMQLLKEHGINYELISSDWFALNPEEIICAEGITLINNDDFKGTLAGDLALTYLKNHPQYTTLNFQEDQQFYVSIANKLLDTKPLNFCQGEMHHGTDADWIEKGYKWAGVLCCLWLLSLLFFNALDLYSLNKKTKEIDEQIAVIYHQFFPDAKQVISPKFRIGQLLGTNSSGSQTHFWFLLNQFAKGMENSTLNLDQLIYQNNALLVTVVSPDFQNLEALENKLKQNQVKVKQTQAATHDQHVVATLELT